MMKNINIHIIKHILFGCMMLIYTVSCNDDDLFVGKQWQNDTNVLQFEAFIGKTDVTTRGDEDAIKDLDPLVLQCGDKPLYLHTYVCDNSFDPADCLESDTTITTRGAQINSVADLKSKYTNFKVQAIYKNDNSNYVGPVMTKSTESDNSIWYVDDTKKVYWPGDDAMLSIFAWAPAENFPISLENLEKEPGKISFSYEAQRSEEGTDADAEAQTDILLAMVDCKKSISESGKAKLHFTHPLSAIKFAIHDVLGGTIKSISIKNVYTKGKCEYSLTAPDNANGNFINSEGGNYVWKDQSDKGSFTQIFDVHVDDYLKEDGSVNRDDVNLAEKKPEFVFMMVPQVLTDEAEIEIEFWQDDKEENKKIISGKINKTIKEWEAGKEYVYIISTSSTNWEYVFEVTGSVQEINDDEPAKGVFKEDDKNIIVNATVVDGAYYKVTSYRYRRNNPDYKQAVAWTAKSSVGKNTFPSEFSNYKDYIPDSVTPIKWFPGKGFDNDGKSFGGLGSLEPTQYNIKFKTQYVATSWDADWGMRAHAERQDNGAGSREITVKYNDKEITIKPIDLSMRNGGTTKRNTANCYVTNSGGWYRFPLYYGNSIKDGSNNTSSYVYDKGAHTEKGYTSLVNFVDYKGRSIKTVIGQGDPIISGANDATLVWGDAYDIIDTLWLDKTVTPNEVIFHIARENLQQSNSVIAIRDNAGTIMWSWHIWVTEYWVNDATLELNNEVVTCEAWAENEDATATPPISSFDVAPRNLGWCDAKNVKYLERTGKFDFIQDKSGKTAKLDIKQREKLIEFWIGNNTYYQWGRKDPMVGFLNSENQVKYNFGPYLYDLQALNGVAINVSIQNPNILYGSNTIDWGNPGLYNDWLEVGSDYYNLWNNYNRAGNYLTTNYEPLLNWNIKTGGTSSTPIQEKDFAYSAVKTVYDPSPAGYVVPPVGFFSIFTKGRAYVDYSNAGISDSNNANQHDNSTSLDNFNGTVEWRKYISVADNTLNAEGYNMPYRDRNFFDFKAKAKRDGSGDEILLTATGHRWYRTSTPWGLGGNFNPHYVYLWSNTCSFYANDRSAFSLAIGHQKNAASGVTTGDIFIITSHFQGRKNMARPIRCVREYQENPKPTE